MKNTSFMFKTEEEKTVNSSHCSGSAAETRFQENSSISLLSR